MIYTCLGLFDQLRPQTAQKPHVKSVIELFAVIYGGESSLMWEIEITHDNSYQPMPMNLPQQPQSAEQPFLNEVCHLCGDPMDTVCPSCDNYVCLDCAEDCCAHSNVMQPTRTDRDRPPPCRAFAQGRCNDPSCPLDHSCAALLDQDSDEDGDVENDDA